MDEERIAGLIEEVIDRKFGHLIISPEAHHRDHLIVKDIDTSLLEFMKAFQEMIVNARRVGISTVIKVIIPGIFALIIGGIILWLKNPIKNLFH
jgi:hypothetical protein